MRTIVIGDIHGNLRALKELLEKTKYDPTIDRLICVGDYVDCYPESAQVINLLISLQEQSGGRNIYLLGNHDEWVRDALNDSYNQFASKDKKWISSRYSLLWNQGGISTYDSYVHCIDNNLVDLLMHKEFFNSLKYYHTENSATFVHAGWDYRMYYSITDVSNYGDMHDLIWDRSLFERAEHLQFLLDKGYEIRDTKIQFGGYDKLFIGHTAQYPFRPD